MQLQENQEYNYSEIAKWFNINYGTFRNTKEKRMKEFSLFYDYEILSNGKVRILKTIIPEYDKTYFKSYGIVKREFPKHWNKNGWDTCKNVGNKIWDSSSILQDKITQQTTIGYTGKAKLEYIKEGRYTQSFKLIKKKWNKEKGFYEFEELTPQEEETKKKICKLFFNTDNTLLADYTDAYQKHQISDKEYAEACSLLSGVTPKTYMEYIAEVEKALGEGICLIRATYLEENGFLKIPVES